jgi:hypothetical protein
VQKGPHRLLPAAILPIPGAASKFAPFYIIYSKLLNYIRILLIRDAAFPTRASRSSATLAL